MKNTMKVFGATALLLALVLVTAQQGNATVYGCTPGYWKNHLDSWGPVNPNWTVEFVFNLPPGYSAIGNATLLEALSFKGGDGIDGAMRILLRAAVASYLNSRHPELGWLTGGPTFATSYVVNVTNKALSSDDRDIILIIATGWDRANNNNLACPLD